MVILPYMCRQYVQCAFVVSSRCTYKMHPCFVTVKALEQ